MANRTSPTVWLYNHAPWLLALVIALALGVLLGVGGTMVDGKYSVFTLLGSVLGAGLGAAGGIVGGLIVQRRRRLDDFRAPAEKLLVTIEWVDRIVRVFLEHDDGFLDEKFIDSFLELRGKEIDRIHGLGTEMNGLILNVQLYMREVQTFAEFVVLNKEKGEDRADLSDKVRLVAKQLRVALAVLNERLRVIVDAR